MYICKGKEVLPLPNPNPQRDDDYAWWRFPIALLALIAALTVISIATALAYGNAQDGKFWSAAFGWSAMSLTIGSILWFAIEGVVNMFLKRVDKRRIETERAQAREEGIITEKRRRTWEMLQQRRRRRKEKHC